MAPGRRPRGRRAPRVIPRVHVVTDDRVLARADFPEAAAAVLAAGAGRIAFHLRGPRSGGRRLEELAGLLLPAARAAGVPLLVNDRIDVALAAGADGVHLGLRSLPLSHARRLLPEGALVGCSAHGPDEAEAWGAEAGAAPDFLFTGPVFPTRSHPGAAAAGPGLIAAVRAVRPRTPQLGIGGVTPARAAAVRAAGAHGVAAIRAVWEAGDPARAVTALIRAASGAPPGAGAG